MAKKFRFRLEALLKIRADAVKEAKNSLNIALRYRYEKERQIENLKNVKQEQLEKRLNVSKAQDMQILKDHINSIDNQIANEELEKQKLIEIENARRMRLNEAMKEEKVILKLKEKKLQEHEQELKREETNFLDEIASQQYMKKQQPTG